MPIKSTFLSLLFILTACLPTPTPPDSGIRGQVTIGPTCPVVQINNPCPDKPYQAYLTVLTAADQRQVARVQTDMNGIYSIPLAPGDYILHPESPNVMPHAADIPFQVEAHQFKTVDVVYDSGIR